MYYNDLIAAGKEMSSLCTLADAAIMLSENEDYLRFLAKEANSKTHKAIDSKEEEEEGYSFLHNFPRKLRSPLVRKSRYSRRFDLNKIPADSNTQQNHLQWPSSSSSSSLFLEDHKTKPESLMINPVSQSSLSLCLMENTTSLKRRRVMQVKKSNGESKKPRETLEWLVEMMKGLKGGEAEDAKLIFHESLSASDVNPKESRLLIPFEQLTRNDFLTQVESSFIAQERDFNNDVNTKPGLGVILMNKWSEKWGLIFKRWDMKKKVSGKTLNYALNCGWNDVVSTNGLKEGDNISLWSFRWRGVLCFALETESKNRLN